MAVRSGLLVLGLAESKRHCVRTRAAPGRHCDRTRAASDTAIAPGRHQGNTAIAPGRQAILRPRRAQASEEAAQVQGLRGDRQGDRAIAPGRHHGDTAIAPGRQATLRSIAPGRHQGDPAIAPGRQATLRSHQGGAWQAQARTRAARAQSCICLVEAAGPRWPRLLIGGVRTPGNDPVASDAPSLVVVAP
jgi:hypothetical protein